MHQKQTRTNKTVVVVPLMQHTKRNTHIFDATREKYFNNNTVILIKSQTNEQENLLVQNMRSRVVEVPLFQPIIQKG